MHIRMLQDYEEVYRAHKKLKRRIMIKNIDFKRVHELDVNQLIEADAIQNSQNCLQQLAYYIDKMGSISYQDHQSDFYVYGRPLYTLRYLHRKAYQYVDPTIQEPLKIDVELNLQNLNQFFVYLERAFGGLHLVEGIKSIQIKNYTDDMQQIIEAEADDQGDLLGVIAWFIDTMYNDNFEVYINGIAIGELRRNV